MDAETTSEQSGQVDGPAGETGGHYLPTRQRAEQIKRAFTYRSPKGTQAARYELLRGSCRRLARELAEMCPESRELALALTKLEEVVMWGNAAIARNE